MRNTECVVVKVISPNRAKREWLERTACAFAQAVQRGLEEAQRERTAGRNRLHYTVYPQARALGLSADYARMAVNAAVALARSYYGRRKSQHLGKVPFPKVNGSQGIGLGVHAYAVVRAGDRFVLRVSTGHRGRYIWLPLAVPAHAADRVAAARGDARLFQRGDDWYVALPVRGAPAPTGCSGEGPTFIGVDLGIVRHAVVVAPGQVAFFDGQADRFRREHGAALRGRYQRHRRTDRVRQQRGKERRWMRDRNHQISRRIVDLAATYPHPVIVLERLEGIRYRAKGGKRFNRMLAAWTFRELVDMVRYKAARAGIPVVLVDPRNTSKTCPACGHATRANRPEQGRFRCVRCGYQGNADYVAARNIAAAGPTALAHGRSDTARLASAGQAGNGGSRLDGVAVCVSAHTDPNLASLVSRTPGL